MIRYKIQFREPSQTQFQDSGDWAPSEECITRMRELFDADFRRDLRVIDEHGVVVASTSGTPLQPISESGSVAR